MAHPLGGINRACVFIWVGTCLQCSFSVFLLFSFHRFSFALCWETNLTGNKLRTKVLAAHEIPVYYLWSQFPEVTWSEQLWSGVCSNELGQLKNPLGGPGLAPTERCGGKSCSWDCRSSKPHTGQNRTFDQRPPAQQTTCRGAAQWAGGLATKGWEEGNWQRKGG